MQLTLSRYEVLIPIQALLNENGADRNEIRREFDSGISRNPTHNNIEQDNMLFPVFVFILALQATYAVILQSIELILPTGQAEIGVTAHENGLVTLPSFSTGTVLKLQLGMTQAEYAFLEHTTVAICLAINGAVCRCYDGNLSTAVLLVDPSCANDLMKPFWLSATIQMSQGHAVSTTPLLLQSAQHMDSRLVQQVTLVLPLTIDDLGRAMLLLYSLQQIPTDVVYELLVFCPDAQVELVTKAVRGFGEQFSFPVICIAESSLFARPSSQWHTEPYGLQMAIKLLASRRVQTSHYLTLDADVILLRPFTFTHLMASQSSPSHPKAIYWSEPWTKHPHWWHGSRKLLGLAGPPTSAAFGVTPAVLSTWGSMLTVETVKTSRCDQHQQCGEMLSEAIWLDGFNRSQVQIDGIGLVGGSIWTEYTLYRTVLDHYQVTALFSVSSAGCSDALA